LANRTFTESHEPSTSVLSTIPIHQPFITLPNLVVQVLIGADARPDFVQTSPPSRDPSAIVVNMSFQKPEKDFGDGPKIHKIRITLTSRKVQSLEKVCAELIDRAKSKQLRVKGPVRLPTKTLKVHSSFSPPSTGAVLILLE
jgi:ribosomal protein S10